MFAQENGLKKIEIAVRLIDASIDEMTDGRADDETVARLVAVSRGLRAEFLRGDQ